MRSLLKIIKLLITRHQSFKLSIKAASQIMNNIKTFVFLDLETTGLPHLEQNKTKITELCMIAVQEEHLGLKNVPRVQNKLNLCFNPTKFISLDAELMTGLSNEKLEHLGVFSDKTVESINLFLDHHPKPICLVAHNGDKFDFPILRTEIDKTGVNLLDGLYCIDSLKLFKKLDKADSSSKVPKLSNKGELIPIELCDGFDELLCQVADEYEQTSKSNVQEEEITKAVKIQQVNETTPKKQIIGSKAIGKSRESRKRLNFSSYKLGDIYQRMTKCAPLNAHQAEADVTMLIICASTLGSRFVEESNALSKKLCDIPTLSQRK
ncbi:three-prime repair exonuclease 1 [Cylas formicarius]|uniref:three-prime repair exonuclease 1 n=1 Tax=Cylas formicarius TaxID=197179 RepID=UPI0029585CDA|nr:three-prime repair exonuclease 1 [Cylas formicarius]